MSSYTDASTANGK